MKTLIGFAVALAAPLAIAHEGHGTSATHWHASDTFGFLLLGAVVAAALWASRRR